VIALATVFNDRKAHERLSAGDREAVAALQRGATGSGSRAITIRALPRDIGGVVASEVAVGGIVFAMSRHVRPAKSPGIFTEGACHHAPRADRATWKYSIGAVDQAREARPQGNSFAVQLERLGAAAGDVEPRGLERVAAEAGLDPLFVDGAARRR